jgi:phosphate transport system substrate-binding protein
MNTIRQLLAAAAALGLVLVAGVGTLRAQALQVDASLPAYQKVSGVSGNLSSIGSDTLNNLMTLWAEGFRKLYPNVNIQIEGKGSSTAPPALISGTAQLGPMSRPMNGKEIQEFEKAYGFKPTPVGVALDALAVYVHKDNPVKSLTMAQVDAIFSQTRKRGHPQDIKTWDQVGLSGSWDGKPISLYGRNSASGTYGFFKEHTLAKGDYKDTVKEQPGSASVVQGVTSDMFGMGYSGIGYKTSGVRVVPLAEKEGTEASDGLYEDVLGGKYPLGRMLYIYVVKKPNEPLSPVIAEFIKYTLSKEGQEVVIKDGYLPLPAKVSGQQLAQVR